MTKATRKRQTMKNSYRKPRKEKEREKEQAKDVAERERFWDILKAYNIHTTGEVVISVAEMSGTNQREIVCVLV